MQLKPDGGVKQSMNNLDTPRLIQPRGDSIQQILQGPGPKCCSKNLNETASRKTRGVK